jgi:crotonobetainyl-CoA:carnitine CoA-transferase CaiB-like acyl-CoA transferase
VTTSLKLRSQHADEINGIVAAWTVTRQAGDIEDVCIAHDVPVGTAYSAADIFADPHMAARGDLVAVEDPVVGPIRQQAPFPRFVGRPTPVPTGAPLLGADNHSVWCGLVGLSDEEFAEAVRAGTI